MSLTEKKQNNDKKAPADCGGSDGDKLALEQRGYVLKLAVASFGLASILHLLLLLVLDRPATVLSPMGVVSLASALCSFGLVAYLRRIRWTTKGALRKATIAFALQLDLCLSSLLHLALAQDDDTHRHGDTWAQWFLLIPLSVLLVLGRKAGLSALAVVGGQVGLILHLRLLQTARHHHQASPPTAWADGMNVIITTSRPRSLVDICLPSVPSPCCHGRQTLRTTCCRW